MMSGTSLLIIFVAAIALLLVAIARYQVHPFLALMGVSLAMALGVGIPMENIPELIGTGFSSIFTSIGIVIILGALIGSILETTGAALKLAECVQRIVGPRFPSVALGLMGWIVGVPVFCDSGFVVLNPIRKALCKKTGTPSATTTIALSSGLYIAHVLIPATAGPLAVAGLLGLNHLLLLVIGVGILISLPCLIISLWYAHWVGKRIRTVEDQVDQEGENYAELRSHFGKLPHGGLAFAPIGVALLAMAAGSTGTMLKLNSPLFAFLGAPVIALGLGVVVAILLLLRCNKLGDLSNLTQQALQTAGPILFITAAGGVLGKVIASAGFAAIIEQHAGTLAPLGLLLPFFLAALLKTAQGSSTVAMVTVAGMLGSISDPNSMLNVLGLGTPLAATLTLLSIGVGSMVVSHANDSYFWVVVNLGSLKPTDGYKTQTVVSLLMGLSAIPLIWLLGLFFT